MVIAAMVESELSGRSHPGRLPASVVGELVADVLRPRGRAVVTRVDLRALPAAVAADDRSGGRA
jgi:hypothetical protein